MKTSILEMLGFTAIFGVCAAFWRMGQDFGMMVAIISLACAAYYLNRLRTQAAFFSTTLIALPMIAIGIFVFALAFGLRHPPFMVPPDWEWPPFASIEERMVHAFGLSIWTFIFGTPTILLLGTLRRLLGVPPTTPETATIDPINPSGRSDVA